MSVIDLAVGEAAKAAALAVVGASTPGDWAAECDAAIARMAATGREFQAADLVEAGWVGEPGHPNRWGARFGAAARAGLIEAVGYAPSKRATVHASICRTWKGAGVTRDMAATGSDAASEQLAAGIKRLIIDTAVNSPRSRQRRIGPSEIGDPCERRLAYKVLDWPRAAAESDPIASVIGTGFHSWMEEAFQARAAVLPDGRPRYKIEEKLTVRDAASEGAVVAGSADLYDRLTGTNYDWKLVGVSSLDKYRRHGPGEQYRIQAHLYGLGQENAGEAIQRVAVVFVGRHHELRVHVWSEPYDRQVALDALDRLDRIRQQVADLDPEAHPARWAEIPTNSAAKCRFCPWLRPGSTDLASGCPGAAAAGPYRSPLHDLVA